MIENTKALVRHRLLQSVARRSQEREKALERERTKTKSGTNAVA